MRGTWRYRPSKSLEMRGCIAKRHYTGPAAARVIDALLKKQPYARAYHCPDCGHYHITSKPPR